MTEIILDSTHEITEAQVELSNIQKIMGKPNYKPKVFIIKDYEGWKTNKQMGAIRSIIEELFVNGCHSSNAETLEELTSFIKTDVIKLLVVESIYDKHNEVYKKRYKAKSMADYTKTEMTQAIKNVLAYVDNSDGNSTKMESIRAGMEKDNINK